MPRTVSPADAHRRRIEREAERVLDIAVLTVSDSRSERDDVGGDIVLSRLQAAGHHLARSEIRPDEPDAIRGSVQAAIGLGVHVLISTGGTGITRRDSTIEAIEPLLGKPMSGFGELFRMLSYQKIGTSTMQSRALGGVAGGTLLFALPGSTGAVKDAWDDILVWQLDARHRPCNLVELMPRLLEHL